jgi:hypothetical protein
VGLFSDSVWKVSGSERGEKILLHTSGFHNLTEPFNIQVLPNRSVAVGVANLFHFIMQVFATFAFFADDVFGAGFFISEARAIRERFCFGSLNEVLHEAK